MNRFAYNSLIALVALFATTRILADEGLKIAVVDSGFNSLSIFTKDIPLCKDGHKNLLTDRDDLGEDQIGHGTVVTKLIHDGSGDVKRCFLIYKVFGQGVTTDAMVAKAIVAAVKNDAKIINLSLGGPGYSKLIHKALIYASRNGVTTFIAAGNDGQDLNKMCNNYPACFKNVKGVKIVGALSWNMQPAEYSNYGLAVNLWEFGDAYGMQGTSFASPRAAARHIFQLND